MSSTCFIAGGGEEFLLVCLEQTALQCNESIDNFYLAMDQSPWPKALKVTASTGVTQLKEHESIRTAIKRADKALYQAKDNGRNQIVTFY